MLILFKFIIEHLFTIFLIIFILLFFIKKYKKIQIFLLISIIIISISPLPNLIVYSIERLNIPGDINKIQNFDKIVILSGFESIKKTKKFNHLYLGGTNNRIIEGSRVYIKYQKKLIFSGSSAVNKENNDGTYVAKKFFDSFNIKNKSVILDKNAKNTEDTFLFLKENFKNEKHLIVTSAMHMQRCKLLAIKNGIDYILHPVDFRANHENIFKFNFNSAHNINLFRYGLREISALLFYKVSGKI